MKWNKTVSKQIFVFNAYEINKRKKYDLLFLIKENDMIVKLN